MVKIFNAIYEGNKKIITIYNKKTIFDDAINEVINDIKNENNNYSYGYRIMEFYDFHLFEDNISKTMILIIETINFIFNDEFKDNLNDEIILILKIVYKELILSVISTENPNFEDISN